MNEQSQDPNALLLQANEEFHHLAAQHHELEDRLLQLVTKPHLTQPEQLEESTLKKRKLQLKDRMEAIVRQQRRHH
ncbi:MAG: YdcH family protein [Vicinamibacterales bacterium]